MTLYPDKFDREQAERFDAVRAEESNYNKNLMDYWVFCVAERFLAEDYDTDTARLLAKSLIQSTGMFAHLPIEERRERVDAFERQRTEREWKAALDRREAVRG
jgi:hypothetical protein